MDSLSKMRQRLLINQPNNFKWLQHSLKSFKSNFFRGFYPHSVASIELSKEASPTSPHLFPAHNLQIERCKNCRQTMVYIKGKEVVEIPFVIKPPLPTSSIELPEKTFLFAISTQIERCKNCRQTMVYIKGKKRKKSASSQQPKWWPLYLKCGTSLLEGSSWK